MTLPRVARSCSRSEQFAIAGSKQGQQPDAFSLPVRQLKLRDNSARATAFGIMNAVYGVAGFLDSVLLGALYDASILAVVLVSTLSQASALLVFLCLVARET
jgi:hypothetical protein